MGKTNIEWADETWPVTRGCTRIKQATEEGSWAGDNEYEQTVLCGEGSHRKPGGIIGAPYLDGVQHLAMPGVPRAR